MRCSHSSTMKSRLFHEGYNTVTGKTYNLAFHFNVGRNLYSSSTCIVSTSMSAWPPLCGAPHAEDPLYQLISWSWSGNVSSSAGNPHSRGYELIEVNLFTRLGLNGIAQWWQGFTILSVYICVSVLFSIHPQIVQMTQVKDVDNLL